MLSEKDWKQISPHPLLRQLSKNAICDILDRYGDGISTFSDGEALDQRARIGFVLSGTAHVQTADNSRRVLLRVLSPGDAFGVAGMFCETPTVSKIYAGGTCRCVFFSEQAVSHLLETSDAFRKNYVGFLSDRIRFLNRKITYLTAGSAERRLALYLISFGQDQVELTDSISALSDLLNLGRASLYRAFDKLAEDGYLLKKGRSITLLHAEAMLNAYK